MLRPAGADPDYPLPNINGYPLPIVPSMVDITILGPDGHQIMHYGYGTRGSVAALARRIQQGKIPNPYSLPMSGIYKLRNVPGATQPGVRIRHTPRYMPPGRKERLEREAREAQGYEGSEADPADPESLLAKPTTDVAPRAFQFYYPRPNPSAQQEEQYNRLQQVAVAADAASPGVYRAQLKRELAELAAQPQNQPQEEPSADGATVLHGTVIKIESPVTLTVKVDDQLLPIKLYGLSTIGNDTAGLEKGLQFLKRLSQGAELTIYPQRTQTNESSTGDQVISAWVFNGPVCLNRELLTNGYAAWDKHQAPDELKLAHLEADARAARRGLWAGK